MAVLSMVFVVARIAMLLLLFPMGMLLLFPLVMWQIQAIGAGWAQVLIIFFFPLLLLLFLLLSSYFLLLLFSMDSNGVAAALLMLMMSHLMPVIGLHRLMTRLGWGAPAELMIDLMVRAAPFCVLVIIGIYGPDITPPGPVCESLRFHCWLWHVALLVFVAFVVCRICFLMVQHFNKLDSICSDAVPFSNRNRFIFFHDEDLKRGASKFIEIKKKLGPMVLPEDDKDSKRVHCIATKIVQAAKRIMPATHDFLNGWEVIVVKDDQVINAWCMPGGKIAVYTGLLNNFRDDAELATVLSHEVSHAIASHKVEKRTTNFLGSWVLRMYNIFPETNLMMFRRAAELIMGAWRKYCVMLPLSRSLETEADYIGLLLLAAAGYDPSDAPSVWKKLGDICGDSEWGNYISTHPSFKKREQFVSQDHVMKEAQKLYRESAS